MIVSPAQLLTHRLRERVWPWLGKTISFAGVPNKSRSGSSFPFASADVSCLAPPE
jgi:hypothetical protein